MKNNVTTLVVIGCQWGDEGKGKIIDILSEKADMICRFQGGNNAGHTVVVGDEKFVFHLLPSGVLHEGKTCVIGNGVVVDPVALLQEISYLSERNISVEGRLFVSDNCHMIMPYHRMADAAKEAMNSGRKIGTTLKGIGPAYSDKISRNGIKLADILEGESFRDKLKKNVDEKNFLFKNFFHVKESAGVDAIFEEYRNYAEKIKPYVADTVTLVNDAIDKQKHVLFEGAQGVLLDVDFGTYPYVTASNPIAGGACTGVGVGPTRIDKVVGVVKAYSTRIGEGPMPTEFPEELNCKVRDKGNEYGATTGRPRRCGWLDSVVLRHSVRINGIRDIVLTKMDVLAGLNPLKICTSYTCDGKSFDAFPSSIRCIERVQPVYEELPGWDEDLSGVRAVRELPEAARNYVRRIEELCGVRIQMISLGSERSHNIHLQDVWLDK